MPTNDSLLSRPAPVTGSDGGSVIAGELIGEARSFSIDSRLSAKSSGFPSIETPESCPLALSPVALALVYFLPENAGDDLVDSSR